MTPQQLNSPTAPTPSARLSRFSRLLVGLAVVALTAVLPVAPAQAAPAGWATFAPLEGTSRDYTSVLQQRPAGFPAATVRTNSVGGSAVGVQGGNSAFLSPQTPPGKIYGANRGEHYLNLRPNGLSTAPPSVTTYTFARPTPATGWTFVLGDIDADQVTISATDAEDQPVKASALGFRGGFNYCAPGVSPKPSCSPPNNDGTDEPLWKSDTETLTGNGQDTAGASAWFEPTVALNTLTFTYAQQSGSPVFQTWFSALAYNLTGTISRADNDKRPISGVTVDLYDPYGDLVGTTKTDSAGQYVFDNQATYKGYRVEVERPTGLTAATTPENPAATLNRPVDLSQGDKVANFALRAVGPSPASGTVTDRESNEPVEGVTVHLRGPGNLERTTTTLADGSYLFNSVPDGDGYVVTIDVPDGFQDNPTEQTFDAPTDSDDPITGLDFDLVRVPSGEVAGTVTDTAGDPLENVLITITGPGDEIREFRTDGDGNYDLADLTPAITRSPSPRPTAMR